MNLVVQEFINGIAIFFIVYMMLYTTYLFLSVMFGAVRLYDKDRMMRLNNELKHDYYLPVSVIMPAYNEEVTIVDSVESLLNLDYKLYEIIIVDDGSTDETIDELLRALRFYQTNRPIQQRLKTKPVLSVYEAMHKDTKIMLIRKENGGKGDALNAGINASRYPYFVTLDADSLLQTNALEKIIQPVLADESVVAVGGMVRIAQCVKMIDGHVLDYKMPWNPIIGMQVVEYDRSFLASRILLDQFSGNLIISGAFGLFKKDVVLSAGGYRTNTIGEDMELVMRLHTFMLNNNRPYKVKYHPEAICWSQAPGSVKDVMKQRRRWYLGLFQSLVSYPEMFTRFLKKPVGFISYIYYWFFELLAPFIEVFGITTIILAYFFGLLNVPYMIELFFIYTGFGIILSLTAFFQRVFTQGLKLHVLDIAKAFVMVTFENAFYRYILSFVRVTAFIGYKKKGKSWGSITRVKQTKV
ncbi:glycosyl transferase family 2 [Halolactibacillus alkaliphilus]|uniref:Glycosyl transferase family 2 n=1 Tax=Halolactibacillus alkaliphilus TaxID=442899 RepID=A0A511X293_9BACI|nr:glycosyltransferase [Halolactibacillus alkaliphilus]GEN57059.1 glycosyl transferase family 2 [Halolactibacillus alkaliphilus]GGN68667.1 glycosyl transferase family 2 [Halolactibacillus alkaliphilus]SFO86093.1 Glycosyltransferase, catalytic subunit of cellulose synthase and poly-beta-1,6-N-acetylglucosamine synthase [Halolactibacillus alkaliphilus]